MLTAWMDYENDGRRLGLFRGLIETWAVVLMNVFFILYNCCDILYWRKPTDIKSVEKYGEAPNEFFLNDFT